MGRGGKLGNKQSIRRRVRSKDKGSDGSDEDYTIREDEECEESDEYCSSFAGDNSDESLGEFEEEEEEEVEVRKVVKLKGRKGFSGRKVEKTRKKKRVSYEEDEEEDYADEDYYDDDEEFMPDEIDYVNDEDELAVSKKNKKVGRPPLCEKGFVEVRKRKRNSRVARKPMRKKRRKNSGLGRKLIAGNDGEFTGKNPVVRQRSKKSSGQKRRLMVHSDSDFESSGSSDFNYAISEEEREQVREAGEFCRNLTASLRSSSSSKMRQEEEVLCQQRKPLGRKGKEKVEELKNEVGKQVCGICLSEEMKKTVRGTLNCCSHYFCFDCIMEWSKVESRCPLCKLRFVTISKPSRSNTGFDLRTVVIQVPKRDQVYQPSEEELRGYLDPYESVICTECQHGGDDALMLLCDLCDSPAHTYCVGLGREVPEGNWYCEGCRPTALGSSTPQASNPTPDQRTSNNSTGGASPVAGVGEGLDPSSMYVPDTPLTQVTGFFSSPRHHVGDFQAASPVSGLGAFTVSERRRIQRLIQHQLNNRMSQLGGRSNEISTTHSGNNIFGSPADQGREIAYQHTVTSERVAPRHTFFEGRLQDNPTPSVQNRDLFSARLGHLRGQVSSTPQAPNPTPDQRTSNNLTGGASPVDGVSTPDQRTSNNSTGGASPVDGVGEGLDPSSMYVPDTPLTQGTGFFSSPRHPVGDFQAASPVSGLGAFTVSERRRIQHLIHHQLNNRMSQLGGRNNGISTTHSGNNTDQRTSNNSTGGASPVGVEEGLNPSSMYVLDTLTQGTGFFSSPRHPVGDFQAASPVSRLGAFTVLERRRIQRLIDHQLNNRMSQLDGRNNGISTTHSGNNTDQRTSNNSTGGASPVDGAEEGLDPSSMYVPDTPLTQGTGFFSSPRHPVGDFQAASPVSRLGEFTVSERRRVQHLIHHMLNNRMSQFGGRSNGISATHSGNNIFGSPVDQGRGIAYQHTIESERVAPRHTFFEGRLQDNPTHSVQNRDLFSARPGRLRGQVIEGPTSTSADGSVNGMLPAEPLGANMGFNSNSGYEQLHPCSSRSNIGSDSSMSPYIYREVSHLNVEKEQVQSMVRSHLKSLSRDVELGYSTFKDIARNSTHTILAACGLEHHGNEVYPVQPSSICNHVEQMAAGQLSLMKGHCSSCFDLFVRDVVREILNTRMPPWFRR